MAPAAAFLNISGEVEEQPFWNGSSLIAFSFMGTGNAGQWLCQSDSFYEDLDIHCTSSVAKELFDEKRTLVLHPYDVHTIYLRASYTIEVCLSEEDVPQHCTLKHVPALLAVVVTCNVVIMGCMLGALLTLRTQTDPVLATVGDGVASFLERPDIYTQKMCLVGLSNYRLIDRKKSWGHELTTPQNFEKNTRRPLLSATSKTRWFTTMCVCCLYLIIGVVLLQISIKSLADTYPFLYEDWALGFGKPNTNTFLKSFGSGTSAILLEVLIANSFQLALSVSYFLYNSLLTAQCSALEWSRHAKEYRPLRVTVPTGKQKSSWFLQLPFKYGIPLAISQMILHFLVSQSIFFVRVQWYKLDGSPATEFVSSVGYSPLATLCSVCVGAALLAVQVIHAARPIDATIPIHGNRSIAISAACHPLTREEAEGLEHGQQNHFQLSTSSTHGPIAMRPLRWGVVRQARVHEGKHTIGHCSLTAGPVKRPIPGRWYA